MYIAEQVTEGSQASENWGALMEICDLINETEEGCVAFIVSPPPQRSGRLVFGSVDTSEGVVCDQNRSYKYEWIFIKPRI